MNPPQTAIDFLEIGLTEDREIVVEMPTGAMFLTPKQARHFAALLIERAEIAEAGSVARGEN